MRPGPTGSIQVAFRIFPEHVEVDVLHSDRQSRPRPAVLAGQRGRGADHADRAEPASPAAAARAVEPGELPASAAEPVPLGAAGPARDLR